MNPALSEPEPVSPPPSVDTSNLPALVRLLEVFHEMAGKSVPPMFSTEVACRWAYWDKEEPMELHSEALGGTFILNLLEKTLRVRFLHEGVCVARILIRLDSPLGLVAQTVDLADHYAATDVGAGLLRRVQDTWILTSLERSIVRGLHRRLSLDDLAKELE